MVMGKWNEEAALNNNMTSAELLKKGNRLDAEFSEELSDAGERNERYNKPRYRKR